MTVPAPPWQGLCEKGCKWPNFARSWWTFTVKKYNFLMWPPQRNDCLRMFWLVQHLRACFTQTFKAEATMKTVLALWNRCLGVKLRCVVCKLATLKSCIWRQHMLRSPWTLLYKKIRKNSSGHLVASHRLDVLFYVSRLFQILFELGCQPLAISIVVLFVTILLAQPLFCPRVVVEMRKLLTIPYWKFAENADVPVILKKRENWKKEAGKKKGTCWCQHRQICTCFFFAAKKDCFFHVWPAIY